MLYLKHGETKTALPFWLQIVKEIFERDHAAVVSPKAEHPGTRPNPLWLIGYFPSVKSS